MSRLKHYVQLNPTKGEISQLPKDTEVSFLPMEAVSESGDFDVSRFGTISDYVSGYTYFRDGDVLLAKITPCFENGKTALVHGLKNGIGFGSTEFHVLRARENMDRSYLAYVVRSRAFRAFGEAAMIGAAGQKRVPESFVSEFRQPFPPFDEQRAIASFLDHQTTKLDQLVEKKQRLIELLQEKRRALINQAVTKGLDPNVPMKDSGIPWLGEIPAHWDIVRNKNLFYEFSEWNDTEDSELLTVSHITGVTRRSEKNVNMFMAESLVGYKHCLPGDLVINTMWAWMGALGISPHKGVASPSYNTYRIRRDAPLYPWYYDYLCRMPSHVATLRAFSTGVWESRLRLYPKVFLSLVTCLPPFDEQRKIVDYLDEQTTRIDKLIGATTRSVELYEEYRQALITAAVTGEIDVRHYADNEVSALPS